MNFLLIVLGLQFQMISGKSPSQSRTIFNLLTRFVSYVQWFRWKLWLQAEPESWKLTRDAKKTRGPPLLYFLYETEPLNPSFHGPTSSEKLGLPLLVQGSSRKYPPSWAGAGCPRCSLAAVAVSALKAGTPTLQWNLRTAWSLRPDFPTFRPRILLRGPPLMSTFLPL